MVDWDYLVSYPSVRFVRVRNKTLATFYYGLNLAIAIYVVVYSILLKKAYQESDSMVGTTALKLKGSGSAGFGENFTIYDSIDLTIPPLEQGAIFVTTNLVKTPKQARGICEGDDPKTELCANGCINGTYTPNGMKTGSCGASGKFCEVMAWCPLEMNEGAPQVITQVRNWTLFAKIEASFPAFGVNFNNLGHGLVRGENLFTMEDILDRANATWNNVSQKGAIILASIYYRCDLDYNVHDCEPKITFTRIDNSSFSTGFNFRYAVGSTDVNGDEIRTLYKVMGMRVIFHVSGDAGQFNLVNLMIALGAGGALLGVSSLLCDFIMQYCLRARDKYTARKYLPVNSRGDAMPEFLEEGGPAAEDEAEGKRPTRSIQSSETTPLLDS